MQTARLVHLDTLSCEPILRRAGNGDLLLLCECGGITEPSPDNRVYSFRSADDGDTWSKPKPVWPQCDDAQCLTEAIQFDDGLYGFFLHHDGTFCDWQNAVLRSTDDGRTWKQVQTPPWFAGRMLLRGAVRGRDGRVYLPYQQYHAQTEPIAPSQFFRSVVSVENGVFILKDMHSPPIKPAKPIVTDFSESSGQRFAWTESAVMPCGDGVLRMLMRLDRTGVLWQSDSCDNGLSWSAPQRTAIPNPGNKPRLLRLDERRIALLHTPDPAVRRPFMLWISHDDMRSWEERILLADFPGTYHYADGFVESGRLYMTIEHNRRDILFFRREVGMC